MVRHTCTHCGRKKYEKYLLKCNKYGNGYRWSCRYCFYTNGFNNNKKIKEVKNETR